MFFMAKRKSSDSYTDLSPPEPRRAHRDRKADKAEVIEGAWGYLEAMPNGIPFSELIADLDGDHGFHPNTIGTYLTSVSGNSKNAQFTITGKGAEAVIRPIPHVLKRRKHEKGGANA